MQTEPLSPLLLSLQDVTKAFDGNPVLRHLNLDVHAGEFLTLLGPSGCGKTTTLRLIAGLEMPDEGQILLDGKDMASFPPEKRPLNTVFQSYALFPHMNVAQNIAYGLRLRRTPSHQIREKVKQALALVQLEGYEKRMPRQLSGGQRQRVAIARAVVLEPRLLLLDEPLGALDLQLRRQMQLELKNLQRSLGIAFIYVTHDQEEALNMSDRIVIMNQGKICQMGTPEEIYEHPVSIFSAQFIGQTNLLPGVVSARLPDNKVSIEMNGLDIPAVAYHALPEIGDKVCLSIRMERILYSTTPPAGFHLSATVKEKQFSGGSQRTTLALADGHELVSSLPTHDGVKVHVGDQVHLWWGLRHGAIVPQEDAQ